MVLLAAVKVVISSVSSFEILAAAVVENVLALTGTVFAYGILDDKS